MCVVYKLEDARTTLQALPIAVPANEAARLSILQDRLIITYRRMLGYSVRSTMIFSKNLQARFDGSVPVEGMLGVLVVAFQEALQVMKSSLDNLTSKAASHIGSSSGHGKLSLHYLPTVAVPFSHTSCKPIPKLRQLDCMVVVPYLSQLFIPSPSGQSSTRQCRSM